MSTMKVVLVADGRSTITRSWLACLNVSQVEIYLVSTFPCEKPELVKEMIVLPVAFSSFAGGQVGLSASNKPKSRLHGARAAMREILLAVRYLLGPATLPRYKQEYLSFLEATQADIVHAMRIPFEGMLASFTPPQIPLVVSTWGNDLTLHAQGSAGMRKWTRRTFQRADGLLADATRDLELADRWGFKKDLPKLMIPGNGGLDITFFEKLKKKKRINLPYLKDRKYHIVNPRGFRPGSVHQDVFFRSLPKILDEIADIQFLCPAMQDQPKAERWVRELGVQEQVCLLPYLPQQELWELYHNADIYISLSSHDGTPNTFLEAIACGCFPIVGDIASLREWVEYGKTGMLIDATDVDQVVKAVLAALRSDKLRAEAKPLNWSILQKNADRQKIRVKVLDFYQDVIQRGHHPSA